jgi:Tol biopolymer transport system component
VLVYVELETGEQRQLTDNQVRDYLPRFAADGSYLSFVSLLQVHISATPFSVPRLLKLSSVVLDD